MFYEILISNFNRITYLYHVIVMEIGAEIDMKQALQCEIYKV